MPRSRNSRCDDSFSYGQRSEADSLSSACPSDASDPQEIPLSLPAEDFLDVSCSTEVDHIPFALCAFAVAVALGALFLVPLTMVDASLSKVGASGPGLYGGLGSTDVGALWEALFPLSDLCHFVVLPFAFFFCESEGFGGRRRLVSKVLETAVTLALVLALLRLLLLVVHCLQPAVDGDGAGDGWAVALGLGGGFSLSYILTSSVGASVFLAAAPFGFERMVARSAAAVQQAARARRGRHSSEQALIDELEAEALRYRLRSRGGSPGRAGRSPSGRASPLVGADGGPDGAPAFSGPDGAARLAALLRRRLEVARARAHSRTLLSSFSGRGREETEGGMGRGRKGER